MQGSLLPTPALGVQQYKFFIDKPAHWREWAAFFSILLCRIMLFFGFIYTLLVVASLLTSPFGFCASLTNRCECSCVVAMPNKEWEEFYHPGGNSLDVQVRTVRPATADDESLCGVCEPGWPECVKQAKEQAFPAPIGAFQNASQWLTCYLPQCEAAIRQTYGEPLSNPERNDPNEDACTAASSEPNCVANLNVKCITS